MGWGERNAWQHQDVRGGVGGAQFRLIEEAGEFRVHVEAPRFFLQFAFKRTRPDEERGPIAAKLCHRAKEVAGAFMAVQLADEQGHELAFESEPSLRIA